MKPELPFNHGFTRMSLRVVEPKAVVWSAQNMDLKSHPPYDPDSEPPDFFSFKDQKI